MKNYIIKFKLVAVCLLIHALVSAQSVLFQDGDRVCFVGNSITRNGEFYKNIQLYYVTRFPEKKITFFNCGISGDDCAKIKKRINEDVLIHKPTHIVIMAGMNDVSRSLYGQNPTSNNDTLAKRKKAIDTYKLRLDSIVNIFLAKGLKVILQKPTIYDQTATIAELNHLGVNDALKICADYIQTLADNYQLPVIDYWNSLNDINTDLQKKNPNNTIIGADRVHPGSVGHLIMSNQFLKTTKAPRLIASIVAIDNKRASNSKSDSCHFLSFKENADSIVFKVLENSLPFPIKPTQRPALSLVPFINNFNIEKLQVFVNGGKVTSSKDTMYNLYIDDSLIKSYSINELSRGINLSQNPKTPQYTQAKMVSATIDSMCDVIYQLRTIALIEFNYLSGFTGNKASPVERIRYLQTLFDSLKPPADVYIQKQFEDYKNLMNTSSKKQLEDKVEAFLNRAYKLAKPVAHTYKLYKIKD